jgi:transcriptional regulator
MIQTEMRSERDLCMFVRPCWKPGSDEEIHFFIERYPWALLVNNGEHGPFATNLPLLLDRRAGSKGVLVGHLARANAHAVAIQSATAPALAIFQGPSSYVTSSWYPQRDMPPTYYYTSVHCYGNIRIQDAKQMRRWVEILTEKMEHPIPNGWKLNEIDEPAIARRLSAIIGFEIDILRLEGKFKLGQDEPKKDAMAVAEHLRQRSNAGDEALAEYIQDYNGTRKESQ